MRVCNQIELTLGTQDAVVLGPNPRRVALFIGPPITAVAHIGFRGHPISTILGITIPSAGPGLWFTYEQMGEAITGEVHMCANSGTPFISLLEVIEG